MTPEQRKRALVRVIWQTKQGVIIPTCGVHPREMPEMLDRLRRNGLKPLYAIRWRSTVPCTPRITRQ